MRVIYLIQRLFLECQILCVENKHKRLTEWLTLKLFVIFQQKKNLNMAVSSS